MFDRGENQVAMPDRIAAFEAFSNSLKNHPELFEGL